MQIYEQKIIGGIVSGAVKPSTLNLDASDFETSELGACLTIAREIEAQNKPIDAGILYSRLAETEIGFYSERDFELMAQTAQSASVVFEAADKVKSAALKTFLLEQTAHLALLEKQSGAEILNKLRELLGQADRFYGSTENNFVFLKDLAPKVKAVYRDLHAGISYAVPSYIEELDNEILDGFSKGDEHIIVGFTGAGKSALALKCARNQARKGHTVGVVSREMSDIENIIRLQSADAKIPRWHIKKQMFDQTLDKLNNHLDDFSNLPIAFDTKTKDVESLRGQVQRMVEDHGMEILYVDYLQLMSSSQSQTNRANEVQTISRTLKEIAMDNKIPVVSLCQFNRGATNASVFDLMSFLKESSGIEQDASTILYVQVEKTEEKKDLKEAKLTVLKNRNGATFQGINLTYRGEIFEFYSEYEQF
jgi:replicative DNA helicase